ncbi:DMT family transporter [Leeia aquatica]|uniref:DMT family transporter n=1 Tax=Leeia aquatica TaxID=2725557 RepID=UPI0027E50FB9|nr:DMT family transporter [Leeia aquatica]
MLVFRVYLKLVLTTLFWGGSFIAGHAVMRGLPPMVAATGRFLLAALVLLGILLSTEGWPKVNRKQWLTILGLALTGIFAYNFFFFKGLGLIPASRAALLVALNPILTALVEALLYRKRLSPMRLLGVSLSLLGTLWVVSQGHLSSFTQGAVGWGELVMLMASLSWVVYTLISRRAMTGLSPLANTTLSGMLGFVLLLPFALQDGLTGHLVHMGWQEWALLAYLAVPGTVLSFLWYAEGIKAVGPQRTIIFTNLVPVFGVLLSVLLLGEQLSLATVLGGSLTIAGVFLTNRVK